MGRKSGKLKVEFIENWKTRNTTFKRRRDGVLTKAKELSTLCDVSTCLILYAPDHDAPTAPPSVWPPNDPALIGRLIRAKNPNSNSEKDDDETQLVVRLDEIAQQIRAEIDRLKSDRQDQFAAAIRDDDGFMAGDDAHQQEDEDQFGHLDNSSSICQILLAGDDRLFGPTFSTVDLTDNSSTAMMPRGPLMVDDRTEDDDDEQRGLIMGCDYNQLFGPFLDSYQEEEEEDLMMMTIPLVNDGPLMVDDRTEDEDDEQRGLIMGCDYNQLFGPFLDSYQEDEEEDLMMMTIPLVNDGPLMVDDRTEDEDDEQRGLIMGCDYNQLFGPFLDSYQEEEEEEDLMMMMRPVNDDAELMNSSYSNYGNYYPQQQFGPVDLDIDDQFHHQYQIGPVDLDPMWLEEEDLLTMRPVVIDDLMKQRESMSMGGSSSCQHPQQQQYELFGPASSSAAAAADLYLYDDDDGEGLITQLYTPPRQSTDLMFR